MHAGLGGDVGKFSQIWARVVRFEWVRLIGPGWVIYQVCWCGYTCRFSGLQLTFLHRLTGK